MGLFSRNKPKRGRKAKNEPRLFQEEDDEDEVELKAPTRSKAAKSKAKSKSKPASRRRGFTLSLVKWSFIAGFWALLIGGLGVGYIVLTLEAKGLFQIPKREPGVMILANNGQPLAQEGSFYGDAARIADLPDYVPNAVIAIEDRRFRSHYGIDPIGMGRAMMRNALAGHLLQGGSTLTQQLAKNLFLTQDRTFMRKAQEAVLAVWLEHNFSKDEILQLYLNRVYFGEGATGIEQAAHTYFNKSASELSVMEAARLAACLKAPANYNPKSYPDESTARAKLVVNALQDQGYVNPIDATAALDEGVDPSQVQTRPPRQYAVDWIDSQLHDFVKNNEESIVVETTIDPAIQANAEKALRDHLAESGSKMGVKQGAMVVMDNSGAVLGMVGGRSYEKSQYNRAIKALRQPGSAFKAFVYLAAFEHGYKPSTIAIDEPVRFGNWTPENYKHKYLGQVSLEQAFAQSINTVAAKITVSVGPKEVANIAQKLGITSTLDQNASLALGTSNVTPLDMTTAFVPFANGGTAVAPYVVKRITSREGKVLYERKGDGLGKVISPVALGEMNQLFRAVVHQGTGLKAQFGSWDIGGKTGTSQDYRDAWFVGFTPYLTAGVWMGNDDNTPTKQVTGGSLPAMIWRDVMEPAHQGLKWLPLPGKPEQATGDNQIALQIDPNAEGDVTDVPATPSRSKPAKPATLMELLFGKKEQAGLY